MPGFQTTDRMLHSHLKACSHVSDRAHVLQLEGSAESFESNLERHRYSKHDRHDSNLDYHVMILSLVKEEYTVAAAEAQPLCTPTADSSAPTSHLPLLTLGDQKRG